MFPEMGPRTLRFGGIVEEERQGVLEDALRFTRNKRNSRKLSAVIVELHRQADCGEL